MTMTLCDEIMNTVYDIVPWVLPKKQRFQHMMRRHILPKASDENLEELGRAIQGERLLRATFLPVIGVNNRRYQCPVGMLLDNPLRHISAIAICPMGLRCALLWDDLTGDTRNPGNRVPVEHPMNDVLYHLYLDEQQRRIARKVL